MSQDKRLVILGASGFVGTTLAERMGATPGWDVLPVIHSAGSAWRLARHGRSLMQVSLTDRDALRKALAGATHVVNCTRGGRDVMIDGFAELLAACRAQRVQRLVHLSSVMVYGDPPHRDSHHEDAPAQPAPGPDSYGMTKLEQDQMVEQAVKDGLPTVVLCPPNISGPFSLYLVGILNGLRSGAFAMVDDGEGPCNLVDVRTLCHAIERGLTADAAAADGRRIFVTDGGPTRWRDVVDELMPLADDRVQPRRIDREALQRLVQAGKAVPQATLGKALRHLVSSDVRAALRKDPLLAKLDRAARAAVARTGSGIEGRLRRGIEGTLRIERPNPDAGLALGLCAQQLRDVRHCNDRAAVLLGFEAPIDFGRSMADFRAWYAALHGTGSDFWPLARQLRK